MDELKESMEIFHETEINHLRLSCDSLDSENTKKIMKILFFKLESGDQKEFLSDVIPFHEYHLNKIFKVCSECNRLSITTVSIYDPSCRFMVQWEFTAEHICKDCVVTCENCKYKYSTILFDRIHSAVGGGKVIKVKRGEIVKRCKNCVD